MLAHTWHLVIQAWAVFLSWNSATTFSIIRDFIVAFVVAALMARLTLGKGWWKWSVLTSNGKQLLLTLLATLGGLLLVVALVFAAAIPFAVYQNHESLVRQNKILQNKISVLQKSLEAKTGRGAPGGNGSGDASSSGPNSPANTGSGNVFKYNTPTLAKQPNK